MVGLLTQILLTAALPLTPIVASELNPQDWLRHGLEWITSLGTVGALAFIALYILATLAFLPGSILTLGAGVIFGVIQGSLYVFVGATLGAILAFLVGRYWARDWVAHKIASHRRFQAIDEAVGREGFKIVVLMRLSPVFPFNLLNYAFGITSVPLKDYALGCIGIIPGTILYVYIGSLAGSLALLGAEGPPSHSAALQWTIRLLGFVATVAVTVYITRIARQALATVAPDDNVSNGQIP